MTLSALVLSDCHSLYSVSHVCFVIIIIIITISIVAVVVICMVQIWTGAANSLGISTVTCIV